MSGQDHWTRLAPDFNGRGGVWAGRFLNTQSDSVPMPANTRLGEMTIIHPRGASATGPNRVATLFRRGILARTI